MDNADRSVIENRIFTNGAVLSGVLGGDTILTGYWGVAINLNYGGFANGYGGGNNTRSYVSGWSAFTINTRTSTTQTTFDKRLFTVMPGGSTTINGLTYVNSGDNSYIKCRPNANGYYLNVGSSSSASSTMYDTITAGIWNSFAGGFHLNACTNNNNVYVNFDNTNGLFSVGGAVPQAKLHLGSGTASTSNTYQKYYSVILNDQTLQYQTLTTVRAIFDSALWPKDRISTSSDERIKTNIQDFNDDSALQKVLLI